MFKRREKALKDLILQNLRMQGLETPLLQKRLIEAWPVVAGEAIARYTTDVNIYNQTLYDSVRPLPLPRMICGRRDSQNS